MTDQFKFHICGSKLKWYFPCFSWTLQIFLKSFLSLAICHSWICFSMQILSQGCIYEAGSKLKAFEYYTEKVIAASNFPF